MINSTIGKNRHICFLIYFCQRIRFPMKRFFKAVGKWLLIVITILLATLLSFYLMAPVYEFSEPQQFSGSKLNNPYESMDSSQWRRYNFQVQSKAWGGMTDGRRNSNERIDSVYYLLGFDHVATSDYQKINYYGKDKEAFIPTYEHGYNIFKTHQVCINAEEVLWTDLFFFQTLSMKQWIIDQLKTSSELVAVAHPQLRNGYKVSDMNSLCNYDLMEVLNHMRISISHWDTALSSGHLTYILANDDSHDVLNTNEVGRRFSSINSPTLDKNDVVKNLGKGNAYGIDFHWVPDEPMDDLVERIKTIPVLTSHQLKGDTLRISSSQKANEYRFIGQNGKLLATTRKAKQGEYIIQESDTYVRTEIQFPDGTVFYLNPVVRYDGNAAASLRTAQIDANKTRNLRILYFLVILSLAYLYARRRQKKSKGIHAK